MAIEGAAFAREFCRVCSDGFAFGWHEANGGNLSLRLCSHEVGAIRSELSRAGAWHQLDAPVAGMAEEWLLVSASGAHLRSMAHGLQERAGIIELDDAGAAWRVRWGFARDARPTSELAMHLQCHELRKAADERARVVYHAHTPNVIALSNIIEPDMRTWTRMLWQCMTECVVVFAQGIGVVPWCVPGSPELAQATCEQMRRHEACVWAQHGIVATGTSCDEAFGTVHTVEKAAGLYLTARAACAGAEPPLRVCDDQLRKIAQRYGLALDESLLEQ